MKILVTGGAGYIGSHVVNLLGMRGRDEIVVLDNLSTSRKESVLFGKFVEGDLADQKLVEELFAQERFDAVMHFAGSIVVPESVELPLKYYENNTMNSLRLIQVCEKFSVSNFIFSSTASIYGPTDTGICVEGVSKGPINPYGHSKLMIEQILEDFSLSNSNFDYAALRYFNVAGANSNGKIGQCAPVSSHLIKIACETAIGLREKMFINGTDYSTADGTCVRDYIHVDDLAQAHLDVLGYLVREKRSDVFNCGYGTGHSVLEVINTLKEVAQIDFKVEKGERRPGDTETLVANSEKLQAMVGWRPKHQDLGYIVKSALNWEKKYQEIRSENR